MLANAEMAGYVMEDTLASTPAAHIIHVWDPKPYHMSCSISNKRPTMMVCLGPTVFINRVRRPV